MDRISGRFARYDAARNAGALMLGVLSAVESKNCWTMAELSGHATPDKLQHLLSRAKWDYDDIGEDLRAYVIEEFAEPGAVLVVDLYRPRHYAEVRVGVGVEGQLAGVHSIRWCRSVGIVSAVDASVVGAGCFGSGGRS